MNLRDRLGILGMGTYLPPTIRKNDAWPEATIQRWSERALLKQDRLHAAEVRTEGRRRVLEAMAALANDPFKGARERRVMDAGMTTSDMEVAAAEDALERAGVDRAEIDLFSTATTLPDYLSVSNTPLVHHRLGLPSRALSLTIDSACNGFLHQLAVAEAMILAGRARRALLVQSSGLGHACRPEDAHAGWFGDAATAVVVGPVAAPHGLLGHAHRTDGRYHRALVIGSPGRPWYRAGEGLYAHTEDPGAALEMLLDTADHGRTIVHEALAAAGVEADDVTFYASHQAASWFRPVTQEVIGLRKARSFDSFAWTASLTTCNVPFMLAMAEREGVLRPGDVVAMYGGGSGVVFSGAVLRWGQ
ncbi:MAG: 3-oxoacyl-[acyl-carrier-protein] synthase III C-terminal domain-containing protein [Minicystis sp.]